MVTGLTETPHKLFVYGTLKQGYGNHHLLEHPETKFIGPATTLERSYQIFGQGIPYMVELPFGKGGYRIQGELYQIGNLTFAQCDHLEGHPRSYRRQQRWFLGPGGLQQAWVYLWPHGGPHKRGPMFHSPEAGDVIEWKSWRRK